MMAAAAAAVRLLPAFAVRVRATDESCRTLFTTDEFIEMVHSESDPVP